MQNNKNLIIATLLSGIILILWTWFYDKPRIEQEELEKAAQSNIQKQVQIEGEIKQGVAGIEDIDDNKDINYTNEIAQETVIPITLDRQEILEQDPRITIKTEKLQGSISLKGLKFDDLVLMKYKETLDEDSDNVILLSPVNAKNQYFADFGWLSNDRNLKLPSPKTIWNADGETLSTENPVKFTWDNGEGLEFEILVSIDENYMFSIDQSVRNLSSKVISLMPYGRISRIKTFDKKSVSIVHEGAIGVFDEVLEEIPYKKLRKNETAEFNKTTGWLGITDKYWLTAIIPDHNISFNASFNGIQKNGEDRYNSEFIGREVIVYQNQSYKLSHQFFAGAKKVSLLDNYTEEFNIPLFDRAVDFGWFYFLTKPIFLLLRFLNKLVGNFGVAIILLTIIIKTILYPLSKKSYISMNKMKQVQPQIKELRERYKDDKNEMNKAVLELYRKEGANPLSGILPLLIQIPVFFSLYKVLFVTIDMRQAPFFGWIKDLSLADPTSFVNLFGLLPFEAPGFLSIGVLPIIMGITMWLQQKMNPQPAEETQIKIMKYLPLIFTFLFAGFPAGLLLYWICSNILAILQQWLLAIKQDKKISKN